MKLALGFCTQAWQCPHQANKIHSIAHHTAYRLLLDWAGLLTHITHQAVLNLGDMCPWPALGSNAPVFENLSLGESVAVQCRQRQKVTDAHLVVIIRARLVAELRPDRN